MGSSRVRQWLKHFIDGNETLPICPILFAYELTLERNKGKILWLIKENKCDSQGNGS
jgi:hypothetical protein